MGSAKKKKRTAVAADKPTSDHQHQPVASKTNYYLALLLIIAAALLYGHSLWNPLVFDDGNFFVDANLERLGSSLFQLDLRWFSYATFGWTYNLFGLDWFWYRLGNLGLHALTGILLFLFFSRLLDAMAQPQDTVTRTHWPAFFAALVFVLHPAAVYGVAYLVQRSIVMATLFGIAALLCYLEGLSRDKARAAKKAGQRGRASASCAGAVASSRREKNRNSRMPVSVCKPRLPKRYQNQSRPNKLYVQPNEA